MELKILFLQTNYPDFLDLFDKKIHNSKNLSYGELKERWANEYFGSSNFYLKNLKPLGWSGDEIIINSKLLQTAWAKKHNIKYLSGDYILLRAIPPRIRYLLGLNRSEKDLFIKQVEYYKPDVVYIHDVTYFNANELSKIKKLANLVVGQIAYPLPLNKDVLKSYDLLISSFPHYIKMFRKMGIKSEYLRWCVEGSLVKSIGKHKRIYNVSYVGGLSPHHATGNKILDRVQKRIKLHIWGYGKTGIKRAWGKDMYTIFAKSKIVINRHIDIAKNYANNMRMFDATAMGALLITDHKDNMEEFFEVGKEVITYKDAHDLVNKIKYYLSHPDERIKIAKAGQKRTLRDHTYEVRMKELDKILRKYI